MIQYISLFERTLTYNTVTTFLNAKVNTFSWFTEYILQLFKELSQLLFEHEDLFEGEALLNQ